MGLSKANMSALAAASGALLLAAWAGAACAEENVSPYLPGVAIGAPSGATPPPGVYGITNILFLNAPIVDSSGNDIPGLKVQSVVNSNVLLWVPNFKVLGATYNVAVLKGFTEQTVDVGRGAPGASFVSQGTFNTILVPGNLSWMVAPDLFVSTGFSVYLPDGTYSDHMTTIGGVRGKAITGTSIGNNTWAFEPTAAVSYLGGGWNLTGKVVLDVQTENNSTHYQSGDMFFFDWTATHTFGKWAAGLGGEVAQQIDDDTGFGAPSNGNKWSLVTMGPVVSYDFGPVTLQAKGLLPVEAANGAKLSELYLTAIWGF